MEQLNITKIEQKTAKNDKPYLLLTTDKGTMSVWDQDIIDGMVEQGAGAYDVVKEEQGGFIKIVKAVPLDKVETEKIEYPEKGISKGKSVFAGMAISYAKDLVIAGKIEHSKLRSESIALMDLWNELQER